MKRILTSFMLTLMLALTASRETCAQGGSNQIPDPLRFYNKFETVWDVVRRSLVDRLRQQVQ